MANPTLYKKKAIKDVKTKSREALTEDEKSRVNATVVKFFELFKAKHLG